MKLEFSRQILEKYANIKFHENSSSWSPAVLFGLTDGRTDMTKLTVAFHNFANAPNNYPTQGYILYKSLSSNVEREAKISPKLLKNITKM